MSDEEKSSLQNLKKDDPSQKNKYPSSTFLVALNTKNTLLLFNADVALTL